MSSAGRSALYEGSKTRPEVQSVSGAGGMRVCLDILPKSSGRRYRIGSVLRNVCATNDTCGTEICGKLCDRTDRKITTCSVPNHNEQVGIREDHSCLEEMYGRPRNGDGIVPVISAQCAMCVLTSPIRFIITTDSLWWKWAVRPHRPKNNVSGSSKRCIR